MFRYHTKIPSSAASETLVKLLELPKITKSKTFARKNESFPRHQFQLTSEIIQCLNGILGKNRKIRGYLGSATKITCHHHNIPPQTYVMVLFAGPPAYWPSSNSLFISDIVVQSTKKYLVNKIFVGKNAVNNVFFTAWTFSDKKRFFKCQNYKGTHFMGRL